mmetsp:Transcript_31874/g.80792  ORF Transcript_31874/g.80792 Transcript_31874/m.80792 type:complete len:362 (+) Transcript_31874:860-1945(+)
MVILDVEAQTRRFVRCYRCSCEVESRRPQAHQHRKLELGLRQGRLLGRRFLQASRRARDVHDASIQPAGLVQRLVGLGFHEGERADILRRHVVHGRRIASFPGTLRLHFHGVGLFALVLGEAGRVGQRQRRTWRAARAGDGCAGRRGARADHRPQGQLDVLVGSPQFWPRGQSLELLRRLRGCGPRPRGHLAVDDAGGGAASRRRRARVARLARVAAVCRPPAARRGRRRLRRADLPAQGRCAARVGGARSVWGFLEACRVDLLTGPLRRRGRRCRGGSRAPRAGAAAAEARGHVARTALCKGARGARLARGRRRARQCAIRDPRDPEVCRGAGGLAEAGRRGEDRCARAPRAGAPAPSHR